MHLIAFDGLTLDRRVCVVNDMDAEPWRNPAVLGLFSSRWKPLIGIRFRKFETSACIR